MSGNQSPSEQRHDSVCAACHGTGRQMKSSGNRQHPVAGTVECIACGGTGKGLHEFKASPWPPAIGCYQLGCGQPRSAAVHGGEADVLLDAIKAAPDVPVERQCVECGRTQWAGDIPKGHICTFTSPAGETKPMNGIELIAQERQRQIESEGWTLEHDISHGHGEMAIAAACYAVEGTDAAVHYPYFDDGDPWPWDETSDKRKKHDRQRQLVIAGALIAAEIDRLQATEENQ